jgi:hypothetical protein
VLPARANLISDARRRHGMMKPGIKANPESARVGYYSGDNLRQVESRGRGRPGPAHGLDARIGH